MKDYSFRSGYLRLCATIICFFSAIILLLVILLCLNIGLFTTEAGYVDLYESPDNIYFRDYDTSKLDESEANKEIKYGYELFVNTPKYIGPNNGMPDMVFSGNSLSCNNCHLLAGTKAYSAPLIGVYNAFPQYRGREDKIGTIAERIDGCMERSMNGRIMDSSSKEMKALISYLKWLSRFAPEDGVVEGQGFVEIAIPNRAVNLNNGRDIFIKTCTECHGMDGQGALFEGSTVYQYPPLWGSDSFNNGAGMNRVITAAEFIKGNMPYGTTYLNPVLSDEEAYDVAGYFNQQQRPLMDNLELDFPNLLKKPISTPYPPFSDPFSVEQHQLGPFQPIIKYYQEKHGIKKTQ